MGGKSYRTTSHAGLRVELLTSPAKLMALEAGELVTKFLDQPFLLLDIGEEIGDEVLKKGGIARKVL